MTTAMPFINGIPITTPVTISADTDSYGSFYSDSGWIKAVKAEPQTYTMTLTDVDPSVIASLFNVERVDIHSDSRAERKVFDMCLTMLDAAGLWRDVLTKEEPGKSTYYAVTDRGKEIVELVRTKVNTIAKSFREDDAIAICDEMIDAWKKGAPALDVLA